VESPKNKKEVASLQFFLFEAKRTRAKNEKEKKITLHDHVLDGGQPRYSFKKSFPGSQFPGDNSERIHVHLRLVNEGGKRRKREAEENPRGRGRKKKERAGRGRAHGITFSV
jgi:hypothetical protein